MRASKDASGTRLAARAATVAYEAGRPEGRGRKGDWRSDWVAVWAARYDSQKKMLSAQSYPELIRERI